MNIHLWFPNAFEFTGGIQYYCACLLQAVEEGFPNSTIKVILKHDRSARPDSSPQTTTFSYSGRWPLGCGIRTTIYSLKLLFWGLLKKPDLIVLAHVNFTPVAYLLKLINGSKYTVILHGVDAWTLKSKFVEIGLRNADQINPVSGYTRDQVIKNYGIDRSKFSLTQCTFDQNKFTIGERSPKLLEQYNCSEDEKIILTLSRLDSSEQYKGHEAIMRALPLVREKVSKIKYLIAGKGDDLARLQELARTLSISDLVNFIGFVPDEQITELYNLSDLFAMPSKGEGFGIVYLEAMGCGKPVLGGNKDGALEACREGELGILVDPDSTEEIAEAVVGILNSAKDHPLIFDRQKLREAAIEHFGFEKFKERWIGVIRDQTDTL